jgi:ubiquinone/menaquinone biosynthesis C-methylase UbiE
MIEDPYEGFAERYDSFFGRFGEHDAVRVDFFGKLFAENRVHSVLDCACGTGHDVQLFHSLGCEVFGSDISESMLAQARKNLAECGVDVLLQKVDYRELHHYYDRKFDAVACLSTSIAEMPDESEVLRAFSSMREVLRDGGILVLTQGTTDKQWKEKPRFILAVNSNECSRVFVIDYFGQGARYNILDILHGERGRDLRVWSIDYANILLRDDQERLLTAAGFKDVDFYGSFHFEPYDKETSNHLIAVAHK